MVKKLGILLLIMLMVVMGVIGAFADGLDEDGVIDEKWGKPVYVYGGSLTEQQVEELAKGLGYKLDELDAIEVTGKDLVEFLGEGNPNANMYSSAIIIRTDKGSGVTVRINTKENITKITEDQYINAMITAGVEDAEVIVDSPKKVTGESALTGIYKVYAEKGEMLDQDRMEVAQLELETTSLLAQELNDEEKSALDDAIIEIKQQLGELKEDQLTEENIEEVVNKALEKRGLDSLIDSEDVTKLVDLAYKYSQTDAINSEAVKQQLEDLSNKVSEKLGDLKDWADETGFWEGIKEFFVGIFSFVTNLFSGKEDTITE